VLKHIKEHLMKTQPTIRRLAIGVFLAATLGAHSLAATTFMSVEPVPNRDVVGQDALATIRSAGYPNLELWSQQLLDDCSLVQNVIDVLTAHDAISTVNSGNTTFRVAPGGFEAVTNPSFANLNNPCPQLLAALASLRQLHLQAVADLLEAIGRRKIDQFLNHQFSCPTP
jgi:hypothetical protein